MMKFIGKLLPVEGYYVRLDGDLSVDYNISLSHLYQPLVGMQAIMLYHTLLNDFHLQREHTVQTHHTLMNYLNSPLDDIYKARLKLEAIGLLKTFEYEESDLKTYTYALQSPFSPVTFLQDAMLSELLYHHIGDVKFKALKTFFIKATEETQAHTDVTASFHEVFETFQPTLGKDKQKPKEQHERTDEQITEDDVDFSWIELMLKQRMIPINKVLTKENKKLISNMMFLYNLATYEIEKSILWALTDENILDVDEFKAACHDLYKTEQKTPVRLIPKQDASIKQPTEPAESIPQTKEEQLMREFETMSPKQLLESLSTGRQASERELKMISDVMTQHGLTVPVMNVLIHYVLIQSNMKLSKPYLETIATHWSRARLTTAKDAMAFAKKEIEKARHWTSRKQSRQRVSKEVIPEWFNERQKQRKQSAPAQPDLQAVDEDKAKEEVMALLSKHSSKNKDVQG